MRLTTSSGTTTPMAILAARWTSPTNPGAGESGPLVGEFVGRREVGVAGAMCAYSWDQYRSKQWLVATSCDRVASPVLSVGNATHPTSHVTPVTMLPTVAGNLQYETSSVAQVYPLRER